MKSDDTTRRIEPAEDRDDNIHVEHEVETEAAEVHEPQPTGWAAQLRQIMQRSTQGEAKTNVKRQQLKEDRTKSFYCWPGSRSCFHSRSLQCSRHRTAERTSAGRTIPISAAGEAQRTRIQATR
jgi:hypothetical protein